jgi:glycosyltransferase involved in cell wall biosynthesis
MISSFAASLPSLVHRVVWQRLPHAWRRSVAFSLANLLAPRIAANIEPNIEQGGPIVVVGSLQTASGLGQSARLCYEALKALGLPVYAIDISRMLMQPDDGVAFDFVDGRSLSGPANLILHVSGPLMPLAMLGLPRKLVQCSRVIGYWAWELPKLPADWCYGGRFVHEIWVPSTFTANALAELAHDLPIRIVPHPIAIGGITRRAAAWGANKPFVVLTMFDMASSTARKNPLGAIKAFKAAFGGDPEARLVIKCANLACFPDGERELRSHCPLGGNVVLLEAFLDRSSLEALYAEADAVISLHRSEGFGLILAEAMLRGLPVVATDWSGNTDFLSEATGMPIGYQLVPAVDPQNTYDFPETVWAEPNITQAAQALRDLRKDPERGRELGEKAAAFAAAAFGLAAYAEAIATLGRPSTSRSVRSADAAISTIAAMQAL